MEATLLETRRMIHASIRGLVPVCGSRAEVLGFHYSAEGVFNLRADAKLCSKCMDLVGLYCEHHAHEQQKPSP